MWDPELEQDAQESNDLAVDGIVQRRARRDGTPNYTTLDSGEKAVHSDGVQRDTTKGKTKFTLMFPRGVPKDEQLIVRVAELYTRGGEKYGDRNWEKSGSQETLDHHLDALWRHFMEFFFDIPSREDHAAAIVWNVNAVEMARHGIRRAGGTAMTADAPYSYRAPGNYGGTAPTPGDYREAFENAPACHHDHGLIARQASQFLAEANALRTDDYRLISWAEGDRLTQVNQNSPASWLYGSGGDVWYFEGSDPGLNGIDRSARSLRNLVLSYGPLMVTRGQCKGWVIHPDGRMTNGAG